MRRCAWSRNLKNVEAMARAGSQRHREGGTIYGNYQAYRGDPQLTADLTTFDMVGLLLTFSISTTSDLGPKIFYSD